VGSAGGGYYSYVPLPFRKSVKVLARAEKFQFYQINYSIYPDSTDLATFTPDKKYLGNIERARKLYSSTARTSTCTRRRRAPRCAGTPEAMC